MIICNINEFLTKIVSNKKILMCLDIGEKQTGVAFSDPSKKFSLASKVIRAKKTHLIIQIKQILNMYEINGIIVGLPKNDDSSLNKKCQSIKDITKNLDFLLIDNKINLPIYFWDEGYSSLEASDNIKMIVKKSKSHKKIIDKFAAKVILQDFLNYINNKDE